ncbi:Helix-turn-helix motif [Waddlia chondrophila 2032/99]|uniref:Helix-turn-helix motif n=1 Tax=Waddlia chondrophila 2032/99 TaxID=765953 RepID=F8LBI0_9BACT|nr:Helix-turn-helix motif [Waddlia chondrophila 2032/99]
MWAISLSGLRYREDLTQKQLGEVIGVKRINISLMERGLRPIGKNIAQRLAKFFNVDYRIFL